MKGKACVEFVVGDIEINETDGLRRSADSLKVIVSPADPIDIDSINECSSLLLSDEQNKSLDRDSANCSGSSSGSSSTTSSGDSSSSSATTDMTATTNDSNHNGSSGSDNSGKYSIPIPESSFLKKKHRLISADSGFGSYGRSELFVTGSIDSMATISNVLSHTTSMHAKPISKHDVSFVCLETEQKKQQRNDDDNDDDDDQSSTHTDTDNVVQRYDNNNKRSTTKNRTISFVNSVDEPTNNFTIDAKLINRCDGFKDVQCYFDEHGSPKVREKNRIRRKSTLKQELKARSLGASYDDETLRKIHQNKTPSCVSFTRLCKKFKDTFCSKFDDQIIITTNVHVVSLSFFYFSVSSRAYAHSLTLTL